jgi:hypothetical protein
MIFKSEQWRSAELSRRTQYLKPVLLWSLRLAEKSWIPRVLRRIPLVVVSVIFRLHALGI